MEAPAGVGLPPAFEDSDIDHLLELIGTAPYLKSPCRSNDPAHTALMLDRLTSINDQIPLAS